MSENYYKALKELTDDYRNNIANLKIHKSLIEAFENSPDFEVIWITGKSIKVSPVNKAITAKELSIILDELLFDLPFTPTGESLDEIDLNIWIGEYPNYYVIHIKIKDSTKCQVIELSSKARIHTYYDKTYAIVCEA